MSDKRRARQSRADSKQRKAKARAAHAAQFRCTDRQKPNRAVHAHPVAGAAATLAISEELLCRIMGERFKP